MKTIIELITDEIKNVFTECGYDEAYAKVTVSNRPDLCEFQCNGATEIEWDIDNEKVSISFKNENINNSLKDYALDYRCKDINIENESSDSEATLIRLMLINNSLK